MALPWGTNMIDKIRIKGNKLICDRWIREGRRRERDVDISKYLMYHLRDECAIEKGTTLRDIISLIEPFKTELSPTLTYGPDWLDMLIEESKKEAEQSMDKIVLSWVVSMQDDIYSPETTVLNEWISTYGIKVGVEDTFAIDLTPLNKLVDAEIRLDTKVTITDERKRVTDKFFAFKDSLSDDKRSKLPIYPVVMKARKSFTFLDILYGIFWELTFHGPPVQRDRRLEGLVETMKKIESGEEKTIPWEEVKANLEKRLKKNEES